MDNSREWHWFKGESDILLSVATYFIFAAIAERDDPFGITAGFGYIAGMFGSLFEGLRGNPVIKRYTEKPDAFIEFFLLIGLILGGYAAASSRKPLPGTDPRCMGEVPWKEYREEISVCHCWEHPPGLRCSVASGCTTGNILQGWAHLSLGSIVAGASFFAGGIVDSQTSLSKGRRR